MYNNFLSIFLEDKILDSQHGFVSGRGTMTAWKELLPILEKFDFVLEYDLKNYFEEIVLKSVNFILHDYGVPKDEVNWLYKINRNAPKLPDNASKEELPALLKTFRQHYKPNENNSDLVEKLFGWFGIDQALAHRLMKIMAELNRGNFIF
jgi:hypothetical protein